MLCGLAKYFLIRCVIKCCIFAKNENSVKIYSDNADAGGIAPEGTAVAQVQQILQGRDVACRLPACGQQAARHLQAATLCDAKRKCVGGLDDTAARPHRQRGLPADGEGHQVGDGALFALLQHAVRGVSRNRCRQGQHCHLRGGDADAYAQAAGRHLPAETPTASLPPQRLSASTPNRRKRV